ncbi:hypothetical protein Syun_029606 [Stephania yunnanensis]|uniref:Uncharacterized protein n=1 Tax=Stephania yunnanensis TaxID=152371 RepID=A0AAP0EAC6_9MAGN
MISVSDSVADSCIYSWKIRDGIATECMNSVANPDQRERELRADDGDQRDETERPERRRDKRDQRDQHDETERPELRAKNETDLGILDETIERDLGFFGRGRDDRTRRSDLGVLWGILDENDLGFFRFGGGEEERRGALIQAYTNPERYIRQHDEIELSALGMGASISESRINASMVFKRFAAIATVVTVSEILKSTGLVTEKKIMTSTVDMKDEAKGKTVQKAKIEIFLKKIENAESPSSTERWTVTAAEATETPVQVMRETENKA